MKDVLYKILLGLITLYKLLIRRVFIRLFYGHWKGQLVKRFAKAGVEIGGSRSHDIQVHQEEFFQRVIMDNSLGLGESYVDGQWDCERLDELSNLIMKGRVYRSSLESFPDLRLMMYLEFHVFNLQTAKRAGQVAKKHYDLGNTLYKNFLDKTMTYTCGYWRNASNLDEAQQHKIELVGQKLKLEPGMKVLELGCGWGYLCKYLAETYQVQVTGVTISEEGARYGQELCRHLPNVTILCQDYRDVRGSFDRVVAVGLLEHVGQKNYRQFFELAHACLPPRGIFLCHSIGYDNDDGVSVEPWLLKYIFPNGMLPDERDIARSIHDLFVMEDWHNFGADYDRTLMAWHGNFVANWPQVEHMFPEPEKFFRMWTFYLLLAAGCFRARKLQLWQIVLSKHGIPGGYDSVR